MICQGCGAQGEEVYPFRCPRARSDDDIDHVLTRARLPAGVSLPRARRSRRQDADESLQYMMPVTGPNPFLVYRRLSFAYEVARRHGMADAAYVRMVEDLDDAVAEVDGHGFVVSPFARHAGLSERLGLGGDGGVWIKNETGNVSGSHKARHLMGLMVYLRALEQVGLVAHPLPPLAIASCGNAALAAAVIARAGRRPLRVFIPPDAPPSVVDRLIALHAERNVCRRDPGVPGDPCYAAFLETTAGTALPFCCQGNENGLTIEGGKTLGYEMISTGVVFDRVVVQVGGGALASSVIQAFGDARSLDVITRLPRFDAVQTQRAHPLKRAYDRIARRVAAGHEVERELRYAATHRSQFMWPWETEPRSIAHGILDDETYDWLAVVRGMLESGGSPLVVTEDQLAEAYELGRSTTGVDVDHTGAAGLAGLLQLHRAGGVSPGEKVALIFSGVERH